MSSPPRPIAILGSDGLLGRHVVQEYQQSGEPFVALGHRSLDVTDAAALHRLLKNTDPRVIINCAAICHFQRCQDHPELSARVNHDAPIHLAEICAKNGTQLVHFSTDYIFDGRSQIPYKEEDAPRPLSVYGSHKAAVEAAFRDFPQHLLLRVAWLFGREGKTFLSLLPGLLIENETLEVASGKLGSCLHARYAAKIIHRLIHQEATGLLNLVHAGEVSWEGFADQCLQELQQRGYEPKCRQLVEVPLEKMTALAGARPIYSVLDLARLTSELGYSPATWRAGLSQYLDEQYPTRGGILAKEVVVCD